jgi:Restriction endonuclease
MNWRDYQEETARFFRSLGYDAVIEENFEGARGTHCVDVVLHFSRHAFSCLWIVECKAWSSKIRKEKVLAFQGIVEDVGADKGIILSEKGFQRGCYPCAKRTNILLSSLSALRKTHQKDLHRAFVDSMIFELERAMSRATKLAPIHWVWKSSGKANVGSYSSEFPFVLLGSITSLKKALRRYREGRLPVSIGFLGADKILANSEDEIIKAQQELLKQIDDLCMKFESERAGNS